MGMSVTDCLARTMRSRWTRFGRRSWFQRTHVPRRRLVGGRSFRGGRERKRPTADVVVKARRLTSSDAFTKIAAGDRVQETPRVKWPTFEMVLYPS